MNITETQQRYTSYQTQSNNSTSKTQSNNDFSSALENFESYKAEKSTKADSKEEEYDEKYQLGLQRYNALGIANGEKWFENSVFEKDQSAKSEFINYLAELDIKKFMSISTNLWESFHNTLAEDLNGNVTESGPSQKNPKKEFISVESTKNYFQDEINRLEEGARKFGGNPSEMIELLTDVVNFFKNYQSKEQEDKYKTLGSNQNAN
ncbi:hypothetical protein [Halarcobacter bivalviorum]|uniref:Uncharacterized protein n=1 Tax=Halarcobacter bivalviorum TaxID=663364 RepID=A0AAX2A748_9BACT|nr:hypothetical protein [Halarcobacter bivalviorum]AXH13310.1 hypothetical protein ABIV_2336 [Halarcobacter bivalviorum]RXK10084.1 hypothetical protein CRV05_06820 [Halarcobacter bivalviorum]